MLAATGYALLFSLILLFAVLFQPGLGRATPRPALAVQAQAPADWPTFGHDPGHTGYNANESTLQPPLIQKWSLPVSHPYSFNDISLAVSDGTLYIGYTLNAVDAATGAVRWSRPDVGRYVAVSDGVVYVTGGGFGAVTALDARTGATIWQQRDLCPSNLSHPAVAAGLMYVTDWQGNRLCAFDTRTGALRWTFAASNLVDSSPAVSDGLVYFGSFNFAGEGGALYALDAQTGALRWQYATGAATPSSPTVAGGVVYVPSRDGLLALDALTGALKWSAAVGPGSLSTAAVANGTVYYQNAVGTVNALDAATGGVKWSFETISGNNIPAPAVANGVVYARNYALDAQTGAVRWNCECNGTPVVADGMLYNSFTTRSGAAVFAFQNVQSTAFFPLVLRGAVAW